MPPPQPPAHPPAQQQGQPTLPPAVPQVNQAMKLGVPIVATPLAMEGTYAEDGQECLMASDPDTFAAKVARVYADCALWASLAEAGYRNVQRHFSREMGGPALLQVGGPGPAGGVCAACGSQALVEHAATRDQSPYLLAPVCCGGCCGLPRRWGLPWPVSPGRPCGARCKGACFASMLQGENTSRLPFLVNPCPGIMKACCVPCVGGAQECFAWEGARAGHLLPAYSVTLAPDLQLACDSLAHAGPAGDAQPNLAAAIVAVAAAAAAAGAEQDRHGAAPQLRP